MIKPRPQPATVKALDYYHSVPKEYKGAFLQELEKWEPRYDRSLQCFYTQELLDMLYQQAKESHR